MWTFVVAPQPRRFDHLTHLSGARRRVAPFPLLIAACLLVAGAGVLSSAARAAPQTASPPPAANKTPAVTKYTCPMHPEVVTTEPGRCPKCGMKLVPKDPAAPGEKK